jgi:uncharacterized protein (DUF2252 family)
MATSATRADRRAAGEAARRAVPPSVFGAWRPAADRPDPLGLLKGQAADRIQELVPIRNGRMAASPFSFLRGAALPMAADLASLPRTGIGVQLCGDAHLCNFGLFASPERDLVFDVNDFDETYAGPWEWDVMRLSASIVVAGRGRGFTDHDTKRAVHRAIHTYRERMHEYAAMRAIDVYYTKVDAASVMAFVDHRARPYLESTVKAATHHDALHQLPKITTGAGDQRRIADRPPTITHPKAMTMPLVGDAMADYRATLQEDRRALLDRYHLVDAALKVVGVGSVGLGAFALLLLSDDPDDPLFLQVKEARASVLAPYLGDAPAGHQGERVVRGQRRLQAVSDVLLGWCTGPMGRELYVRQLQDAKGSPVVEVMTLDDLTDWGQLCAWSLARGHARSGPPAEIAGYLGDDDQADHAMADFAVAYADQTERDHAALRAAISAGTIDAETGA